MKSNDSTVATRRHLQFGWWSLLIFLSLGIILEALHGFKIGGYLSVSNSTRRLMWTLAHAHGTVLSLVHIAFAFTIRLLPDWATRARAVASSCLTGATVLIPSGFFLGGLGAYRNDPAFGIMLVPVGAVLLIIAVVNSALAMKAFAIVPTVEPMGATATPIEQPVSGASEPTKADKRSKRS
jgi:hypothetical protein